MHTKTARWIWSTSPSCTPAASHFLTSNAQISPESKSSGILVKTDCWALHTEFLTPETGKSPRIYTAGQICRSLESNAWSENSYLSHTHMSQIWGENGPSLHVQYLFTHRKVSNSFQSQSFLQLRPQRNGWTLRPQTKGHEKQPMTGLRSLREDNLPSEKMM